MAGLHEATLVLADDEHQHDGGDGHDDEEAVGDVSAEVVDEGADTRGGEGRAEQVAEEAGEACCGARDVTRRQVDRLQADQHDRAVDQTADDRNEDVEDPDRSAERHQPVDEHAHADTTEEEDARARAPALEDLVRDPTAQDRADDAPRPRRSRNRGCLP